MLYIVEHCFYPNSEAVILEKNKLNQNIEIFMFDKLKVILQEFFLESQ